MVELIDKLTEKLYQEGVEKARAEGKSIRAQAEKDKNTIIQKGKEEANRIIADAQKKADDLRKTTETDVRMASQKAIATVRQRIEDVITVSLAEEATDKALEDSEFVMRILEKVIEQWNVSEYSGESLLIKLPEKELKKLEKYFFGKAKQEMNNKITLVPDAKIKAGFVIGPGDGKFKVGFSDKDFNELFQFFLRPRIKEFLFGKGV